MKLIPIGAGLLGTLAAAQDLKLLAPDGDPGDTFGISVGMSGTTAVVGARLNDGTGPSSGAAYLFDVATGQHLAKLLPAGISYEHWFGSSVALDGDTVVVGSPDDYWNGSNSGSAYLFDAATGQRLAKLGPADTGNWFGASVAVSGTTAIVGAPGHYDNGSRSGAAYLFDVATGQQLLKLLPTDGQAYDEFGRSVAIHGDTAIIGAPRDQDNGYKSGSAYLFDVGSGQQIAKLLAADGVEYDNFGVAVAINGTTAIVGVPGDDDSGASSGAAYLFDVATGQAVGKLLAADGVSPDRFGNSVAVQGDTAIVGAAEDDDNGDESGSIYVFRLSTGSQIAKLRPADGSAEDRFGCSVAVHGTRVVVGAFYDDDNGTDSGSAYLFEMADVWIECPLNGHWYCSIRPLSWQDSEEQAQAWGGHLATVRDQAENDWLASTFAYGGVHSWIGYHDSVTEGLFEWASGEDPGYESWQGGEPDDANDADWAVLIHSTGGWADEALLPQRRGLVEVISSDCNQNDRPDTFEIALDPSMDWNGDGVLDECWPFDYCTAAANSTGVPAEIGASGSPLVADNAFTLEAWDMPLNEFAYFLMSESTAFVPNFGGSSGNLCVGAPIVRLNNPAASGGVLNSGTTGTVSLTMDLTNLPQGTVFLPGDTWYFQLWFRDFTTGPTSNTTDGIEVMFR